MLSSIHPLGERAKGNRFWLTATSFVVGSIAGGMTTGGAAAAIGQLLPDRSGARWPVAIIAAFAALAAVAEARGWRAPGMRRQVDEDWLHAYRGWVYGSGFGWQLGLGWITIVNSWAFPVAVAAAVLAPSPAGAVAIPTLFGAVRGLSVLATARVDDPAALIALHRRLQAGATLVRRGAVAALAALALVTAASMV